MLGSAAFLQKAGAAVGFGAGEALLREVAPGRIFRLEKSKSGLLMINLVEDPLSDGGEAFRGDGLRRLQSLATE
eukprot:9945987-Alexandrium_andersonii.AAC.1